MEQSHRSLKHLRQNTSLLSRDLLCALAQASAIFPSGCSKTLRNRQADGGHHNHAPSENGTLLTNGGWKLLLVGWAEKVCNTGEARNYELTPTNAGEESCF